MIKLYSHETSKYIDNATQTTYKIPDLVLMERAGVVATELFIRHVLPSHTQTHSSKDTVVVIVAGKGNNGADALVCARELSKHHIQVLLYQAHKPKTQLCKLQDRIIRAMGLRLLTKKEFFEIVSSLQSNDWIIDGIYGIGLSDTIRDTQLVEVLNSSKGSVFSLDVPSGFYDSASSDELVVHADHCVCFGVTKMSLFNPLLRKHAGVVHTVDIGFPTELVCSTAPQALLLQNSDLDGALSPLSPEAYKYSKGVCLIAAGSDETPGAAILALKAATLGACGLVVGLLDKEVQGIATGSVPSVITGLTYEQVRKIDSIVVGPGWGKKRKTMLKTLHARKDYIVMDADSLHEYKLHPFILSPYTVMTPHSGEYSMLEHDTAMHSNSFIHRTQELANVFSATIVAKAPTSLICFPDHFEQCPLIVDGSTPILGTAGSGDILSGVLGSTLAYAHATRGFDKKEFVKAVWFSVLLHNYLGQRAQSLYGSANSELLLHTIPHIYDYASGKRKFKNKKSEDKKIRRDGVLNDHR